MAKFVIGAVSVVALGILGQQLLPWWSIAGLAAIVGIWIDGGCWKSLAYGVVGGVLLWGGYALWQSIENDGILAARMGHLLNMPAFMMVIITALIGGLVAGLGAMCGSLAGRWLKS